jgi:pimeloyl-ACP methyl ester carboxylesterase
MSETRGTTGKCSAKTLDHSLARPMYALDLRNHGHSPAAVPHTYSAMAADGPAFLVAHNLSRVQLLGRWMGGKGRDGRHARRAARPGEAGGA